MVQSQELGRDLRRSSNCETSSPLCALRFILRIPTNRSSETMPTVTTPVLRSKAAQGMQFQRINLDRKQTRAPSTLDCEHSIGPASHAGNGKKAAFGSRHSPVSLGRFLHGVRPPKALMQRTGQRRQASQIPTARAKRTTAVVVLAAKTAPRHPTLASRRIQLTLRCLQLRQQRKVAILYQLFPSSSPVAMLSPALSL